MSLFENRQNSRIQGTEYEYSPTIQDELNEIRQGVGVMRSQIGALSPEALKNVKEYFRIKDIYNSNAIEGNSLSLGETRMVIREGLTISGKPLKDSIEAKNLAQALDFFEELADARNRSIDLTDIRNMHHLILQGIDDRNAGKYRTVFVEISGSRYRPPDPAKIMSEMDRFGVWLKNVTSTDSPSSDDPIILACVAHLWFVIIHPFIDGNGRTARLLMNLILLRYGYPLAILTRDDRQRYYDALEDSQGGGDLTPFARLIMETVQESFEVYARAADQQLQTDRFVAGRKLEEENRLKTDHQVFSGAMNILVGAFRQIAQSMEDASSGERVYIREFGSIELEKYEDLRAAKSAKRTWFFRLIFEKERNGRKDSTRYLFFFGFPSRAFSHSTKLQEVVLHVATETFPTYYERLADLSSGAYPDITELTYDAQREQFVYRTLDESVHYARAEQIARAFAEKALDSIRR